MLIICDSRLQSSNAVNFVQFFGAPCIYDYLTIDAQQGQHQES